MLDTISARARSAPDLDRGATRVFEAAHDDGAVFTAEMDSYLRMLREEFLLRGSEGFRLVAEVALRHPVRTLFHADPFTRRTFEKPRGYAGDAVMLDYIYGPSFHGPLELDKAVQRVFLYTTNSPACQAVRYRREQLAIAIDRAAMDNPRPRIIALACGHLRELTLSRAIAVRRPMEFIGIDQDDESLSCVRQDWGSLGVQTLHAGVREILKGQLDLGKADLIYAAGLFDYLPDSAATALIARCFQALKPGGSLLYANFLPAIEDIGYMASFMDWRLLHRSDVQTRDLAKCLPDSVISSERVWCDPTHNIAFVELRKA